MLLGLGEIAKAGLLDENPEHLGILLKRCRFDAVISMDGGRTWKIATMGKLPTSLKELPVSGPVRYSIGEDDYLFQRSDDAGHTWTDASPWKLILFAGKAHYRVEHERYLNEHGHWLPNVSGWPYVFGASLAGWTLLGGFFCRANGRPLKWIWLQSVLVALILGFGSYLLNTCFQMIFKSGQWTLWGLDRDDSLAYPLWPLGVFLQLTGNAWLAPLFAFVCMTATALYFAVMDGATDPRVHETLRIVRLTSLVGMLLLVVTAILPGYGWMPKV